jgi:hypothetical protein
MLLFFFYKISLQTEAFAAGADVVCIAFAEITFGKAEIVNGVKEICFAGPVIAAEACYPFSKIKGTVAVIFKLNK